MSLENEEISNWENLNLNTNLLRGIYSYGFENPSPIQQKAIKPILDGKDVIAQSQSGTGKTGCFVIATLQKIDEQIKKTGSETNLTKDDIIAVINSFEPKFTSYVEDNTAKIFELKENYINKNISGQELIDGMVELGRLTDKGVAVRYSSSQRQRIAKNAKTNS